MMVIIKTALDDTWAKSFAHGQMQKWCSRIHGYLFNADGMLNMYEIPTLNKFQRCVSAAKIVLETVLRTKHSAQSSDQGELYPRQLVKIIQSWKKLKGGAEDLAKSLSQSAKNRDIQDEIIGSRIPMGNNSTAKPRASTVAAIRKNGQSIAPRGKDFPSSLSNLSSSGESACAESPGSKKKRPRTSEGSSSNVQGVLDESNSTRQGLANALTGLTESLKPKELDKDTVSGGLALKNKVFAHAVDVDSKKMEVEKSKVALEKERMTMTFMYRKEKKDDAKDMALVQMLKLDYDNVYKRGKCFFDFLCF